ncbi:MAG: cytidine deaminase [Clostridiaceae bacterium]|nr:cytidine deaminase [Clostridiaceae bacterium]
MGPYSPEELIKLALKAKDNAYVPYSQFHVGAALVADDGKVYTGCNVENSSYGATICAERSAIVKAVSEGAKKIREIAVVSDSDKYTIPCAICLQVMSEFCEADMKLHLANNKGEYRTYDFKDLLPTPFNLSEQTH